jgi:hypothetical protein
MAAMGVSELVPARWPARGVSGRVACVFGPLGQAGVDGMRYLWENCLEGRFAVGRLGRDKDGGLSGGGKRRLSVVARRKEVGGGMR